MSTDRRDYLTHHRRIVAFNRSLVAVTGSATAALMLSQMIFLTTDADEEDTWLFHSRQEWFYYTGLSRAEQETARKTLRKLGVIEECLLGMPAMNAFRIVHEKLREALENVVLPPRPKRRPPVGGKPANSSWRETSQQDGGKPANMMAGNQPAIKYKTLNTEKDSPPPPLLRNGGDNPPSQRPRRTTRQQRRANVGVWNDDGWTPPNEYPDDPRAQRVHDAMQRNPRDAPDVSLADLTYFNDLQRKMREEHRARRVN